MIYNQGQLDLIKFLSKNPQGLGTPTIARHFGVSTRGIVNSLNLLVNEGLVVRWQRAKYTPGLYFISSKGKELIDEYHKTNSSSSE